VSIGPGGIVIAATGAELVVMLMVSWLATIQTGAVIGCEAVLAVYFSRGGTEFSVVTP
jgi:hypothetical protein